VSRAARWILAVVALQAALVGLYWLIEQRRSRVPRAAPELTTAPPTRASGQLASLSVRGRDGRHLDLRRIERRTLVHFWATWCPPCRTELPGLLALPDEHPVDVVAVALDRDWTAVDRFLGSRRPSNVFLGDSAAIERAFAVRSLPVTYLVEPGGRLRLRFDGARDWTSSTFLQRWLNDADRE
jgi:thiol-disulfide isomerase/thioredoxin